MSSKGQSTRISIIVPVYNEYYHIVDVIERILKAPMLECVEKEVIIVDDGSTDGTSEVLERYRNNKIIQVYSTNRNVGKGSAIRTGLQFVTGDIVVIQDGDREYHPEEIICLITPILEGKARVVYGSRFLGTIEGMLFQYRLMNQLLIIAVRLLYGTRITDEATAYKAFDRQLIQSIPLRCKRFEFCPEITAKVLRGGDTIYEVPITYSARTRAEGKKIRFSDAIEAFWTLLRYRFWKSKV